MTGPVRRLHPLTPLVRGWKAYAAFAVVVGQQVGLERHGGARIAAYALLAALPVAALLGWLGWRTTSFGFDGEDLRIDSGLLVRRSRRIRLDRLQAVDVVRPLLARLAGLAELRLEVAGGGKQAEGGLAYLGEADALALRAELLARAAGVARDDRPGAAPAEPEEHLLHEVPTRRYVASLLLQGGTVVGLLLVGVAVALAVVLRTPELLVTVLPPLVVPAHTVLVRGQADALFAVAGSAAGLRLRHGLFETRHQTVPPGRVQAVRVVEPLLWRRRGWVRLEVTVAGYGKEATVQTGTLLPVVPAATGWDLVDRVLGAEVGEHPGARTVPLAPPGPRARWLDPLAAPVLGAGADDQLLVVRTGALRRVTTVVPHAKVQSTALLQGPVQRRLGLASLEVHVAPTLRVRARHRATAEAGALLVGEVERARTARRVARSERWAEAPVEQPPG
ncbi:putative membrane protein [Motilibacter rhizosphaerae]|uniref:Putative membrane protein n=1 Tax=Motilibacter rhizosphaerae TaxID=598652 RepID=A0A4Q7NAE5_9ACTN|nr:PH domain-containing protein [Motilibacter rhizosphaerae]RZS79441.1 putative membrane protein [Motilibacter rhizosphaerae]